MSQFTKLVNRYGEKELEEDIKIYKSNKKELDKIAKILLTDLPEVYKRFDKEITQPFQRPVYFRDPIVDVCMKAVQVVCFKNSFYKPVL